MCIELICDECRNPYRVGGPGYQPIESGEHGIGFVCRDCVWKKQDYTMTPEWVEAFRMNMALLIREVETSQAEKMTDAARIKSAQHKFDSEIFQFQRQLIAVMSLPLQQLAADIKAMPSTQELRGAQQDVNRWYADMVTVAENPPDPAQSIFKLILRQATYFLLLMLAVGVGLAVLL